MAVRLEDVLASLPAKEQAAIQARFDELRAECERERDRHADEVSSIRADELVAVRNLLRPREPNMEVFRVEQPTGRHSYILVTTRAPGRSRDADLPAVWSAHG